MWQLLVMSVLLDATLAGPRAEQLQPRSKRQDCEIFGDCASEPECDEIFGDCEELIPPAPPQEDPDCAIFDTCEPASPQEDPGSDYNYDDIFQIASVRH